MRQQTQSEVNNVIEALKNELVDYLEILSAKCFHPRKIFLRNKQVNKAYNGYQDE